MEGDCCRGAVEGEESLKKYDSKVAACRIAG